MRGSRTVLVLAVGSAGVCLATGVAIAIAPLPFRPFGGFLAVLALLGSIALAGAGAWQHAARAESRRSPLIVLAVLAAGYMAANGLGILVADANFAFPKPLHEAGLAAAFALFAITMADLVQCERSDWRGEAWIRLDPWERRRARDPVLQLAIGVIAAVTVLALAGVSQTAYREMEGEGNFAASRCAYVSESAGYYECIRRAGATTRGTEGRSVLIAAAAVGAAGIAGVIVLRRRGALERSGSGRS